MAVTVAVDAGGADLGPAEVARGAANAVAEHGVRVLLFGAAERIGDPTGSARCAGRTAVVRSWCRSTTTITTTTTSPVLP